MRKKPRGIQKIRESLHLPRSTVNLTLSNIFSTKVHNLVLGNSWVDHPGTLTVKNVTKGDTATVTFEECNWFYSNLHNISGSIKNGAGKEWQDFNNINQISMTVQGKWSESVSVTWKVDGKEKKGTTKVMWKKPENNSVGKHNLTPFAESTLGLSWHFTKIGQQFLLKCSQCCHQQTLDSVQIACFFTKETLTSVTQPERRLKKKFKLIFELELRADKKTGLRDSSKYVIIVRNCLRFYLEKLKINLIFVIVGIIGNKEKQRKHGLMSKKVLVN
jgi:hypothetical protein